MVRLDVKDHEPLPVKMDHTRLSTFPTRSDPLFIKIVEVIRALLSSAAPRTTEVEPPFSVENLMASLESLGHQSGMSHLSASLANCLNSRTE